VSDEVELEEESFPSFGGAVVFVSGAVVFVASAEVFLVEDDPEDRLSFL
jgi:hypothetical protein